MSELARLHDLPDGRSNDAVAHLRPYLLVPAWAHRLWHCLWFDHDGMHGVGVVTVTVALELCALSERPDETASVICAAHRMGGDVRTLLRRMGTKEENDAGETSGV